MKESDFKKVVAEKYKDFKILYELPIEKTRLDMAVLCDEPIAIEIKTDHDTLKRLDNQIYNYYRLFSRVVVVAGAKHKRKLVKKLQDTDVGLYILTDEGLEVIKEPVSNTLSLDKRTMFNMLRKYEFTDIILDKYGYIPDVGDFDYYSACYRMIEGLNVLELQNELFQKLKEREKGKYGRRSEKNT